MTAFGLLPLVGLSLVIGTAAPVSQEDSVRRRTTLPNGSIAFVERMPGQTMSVQLIFSARGIEETAATNGTRHLAEHLLLNRNDLDARLESKGMLITGRTFRDAMQFEVLCEPAQLSDALTALREIVSFKSFSEKEIRKEVRILAKEEEIIPNALRLGRVAWRKAFGEHGLDPFGDLQVLDKVRTSDLTALVKGMVRPGNATLVAAGNVDLTLATEQLSSFLLSLPGSTIVANKPIPDVLGSSGRAEALDATGECRAAICAGFSSPKTAAVLAAAFGVASRYPSSFVTYTPSITRGLVLVGRNDEPSGVGLFIDDAEAKDVQSLFFAGKTLAMQWIDRQLSSPSSNGWIRGLMFSMGAGFSPDQLRTNIRSLSMAEFVEGFDALRREIAVVVTGLR